MLNIWRSELKAQFQNCVFRLIKFKSNDLGAAITSDIDINL